MLHSSLVQYFLKGTEAQLLGMEVMNRGFNSRRVGSLFDWFLLFRVVF